MRAGAVQHGKGITVPDDVKRVSPELTAPCFKCGSRDECRHRQASPYR